MSKMKYLLLLLVCVAVVLVCTSSAFADRKDFTPLAWDIASQNPGWTYDGPDWAWGMPSGEGGDSLFRGRDPTAAEVVGAQEGEDLVGNVIGTNLTGNYSPDSEEYATSSEVDCTDKIGVQLTFTFWLAVQDMGHDQAVVEVSNGDEWVQVWANGTPATNQPYTETQAGDYMLWNSNGPQTATVDLSTVADNQEAVQIRFGLISDGEAEYGGWNIASVALSSVVNDLCDCPWVSGTTCADYFDCIGVADGSEIQAALENNMFDTWWIMGPWIFEGGWQVAQSQVGTSGQPLPAGLPPPYDTTIKGVDPAYDAANEYWEESADEVGYILGYNVGDNYEGNMAPKYLYMGLRTRQNCGDMIGATWDPITGIDQGNPDDWWIGGGLCGGNVKVVADRWLAVESALYDHVALQADGGMCGCNSPKNAASTSGIWGEVDNLVCTYFEEGFEDGISEDYTISGLPAGDPDSLAYTGMPLINAWGDYALDLHKRKQDNGVRLLGTQGLAIPIDLSLLYDDTIFVDIATNFNDPADAIVAEWWDGQTTIDGTGPTDPNAGKPVWLPLATWHDADANVVVAPGVGATPGIDSALKTYRFWFPRQQQAGRTADLVGNPADPTVISTAALWEKAEDNPDFQIRFRMVGSSATESIAYLDNVYVYGVCWETIWESPAEGDGIFDDLGINEAYEKLGEYAKSKGWQKDFEWDVPGGATNLRLVMGPTDYFVPVAGQYPTEYGGLSVDNIGMSAGIQQYIANADETDMPSALSWDESADIVVGARNVGNASWEEDFYLAQVVGPTNVGVTPYPVPEADGSDNPDELNPWGQGIQIQRWGLTAADADGETVEAGGPDQLSNIIIPEDMDIEVPGAESYGFEGTVVAPPISTMKYKVPVSMTAPADAMTSVIGLNWTLFNDDDEPVGVYDNLETAMPGVKRQPVNSPQDQVVISRFPDIGPDTDGYWARFWVEELAGKAPFVVQGFAEEDGTFTYRSTMQLDRATMSVYIQRAMAIPTAAWVNRFRDVPRDHWAAPSILALAGLNIVQGYPPDYSTFGPENIVTRDQMAKFIANGVDYVNAAGINLPAEGYLLANKIKPFKDVSYAIELSPGVIVENPFARFIYALRNTPTGIASYVEGYAGVPDTPANATYRPADPVDRGQLAVYVWRAFIRDVGTPVVLAGPAITDSVVLGWWASEGADEDTGQIPLDEQELDEINEDEEVAIRAPSLDPVDVLDHVVTVEEDWSDDDVDNEEDIDHRCVHRGYAGWRNIFEGDSWDQTNTAYVSFDAFRLKGIVSGADTFKVKFELRAAKYPTVPATLSERMETVEWDAAEIDTKYDDRLASGIPYLTAYWELPEGTPTPALAAADKQHGDFVLAVSIGTPTGVGGTAWSELSRKQAYRSYGRFWVENFDDDGMLGYISPTDIKGKTGWKLTGLPTPTPSDMLWTGAPSVDEGGDAYDYAEDGYSMIFTKTQVAERNISTVGFKNIVLSFNAAASFLAEDEVFSVAISTDGGLTYETIYELSDQDWSNPTGVDLEGGSEEIELPSAANGNPNFWLKIGLDAATEDSFAWIDHIMFKGL